MSRQFTQYWCKEAWVNRELYLRNFLLNHTAGKLFAKRDIGDEIYVVTTIAGKLYLRGKLIIGKICDGDEAAAHLGCEVADLWPIGPHVLASAATSTFLDRSLPVPLLITQSLRFKSKEGLKSLEFSSSNYLRNGTLGSVRELDSASALELDKLLPSLVKCF
jgi:hypothetical protein